MGFVIADRVKETSVTSGTGSIQLNGAFGGFQTFASAIGDNNSTFYAIENEVSWEVGIGTYFSSTNTLARDVVFSSSNSNNKISLNGVSVVFCNYPAKKSAYFNQQDLLNLIGQSGILFPDGSIQTVAGAPYIRPQKTISSNYTATTNDYVILIDCSIDNVDLTLPQASGNDGKVFDIKRKAGGTFDCKIYSSNIDNIDGQNYINLYYDYEAVSVISDNNNWFVF